MTINYNREFHGQEKLASPQPMAVSGSLKCIYSGQTFCDNWVKSYNQYTSDFNKAQDRAGQEFMLDQRHKFYVMCCSILAEIREQAALDAPSDLAA